MRRSIFTAKASLPISHPFSAFTIEFKENTTRIRKKPWAESELSTNAYVVQEPESLKGKWNEYFGNDNPIYIEIGCGKGRFIAGTAKENPNVNFIGIERDKSVSAVAVRRLGEDIENIAFICADAGALENYFDTGEIKRIYLNFSDPCPEKNGQSAGSPTKISSIHTKRFSVKRVKYL